MNILEALSHLSDDAMVTISVTKTDLVTALEEASTHPERIVTTSWCAEHLGKGRAWWAKACEAIPEAFQEAEGGPWSLPYHAAKRHLARHVEQVTRARSVRRGPRRKA